MQPRLTRSRTDSMIAGVCGGLAEYFVIDPVIVRLIFVLVTITSGIGLPIYFVLWLAMPKAGAQAGIAQQLFPHDAEEWRRRAQAMGQEATQVGQHVEREVREVLRGSAGGAPPTSTHSRTAEPHNFDPLTGEPLHRERPSTGQTINLDFDTTQIQPTSAHQQSTPPPQPAGRRRFNWAGFILMGLGFLFLADYFHFPTDIVFPILMIVAGVVMMIRRSQH